MYALYSRSQRGHLFHFSRLVCLPDSPNNLRRDQDHEEGTKEEDPKVEPKAEESTASPELSQVRERAFLR